METQRRWRMRAGRSAVAALPAPAGRRWRGRRPGCLKRRGRRSPRRCGRLGWRRPRRPGRLPRSHPPAGQEQRGAAAAAARRGEGGGGRDGRPREARPGEGGGGVRAAGQAPLPCGLRSFPVCSRLEQNTQRQVLPPSPVPAATDEAGGPQPMPGPQRGAKARGAAAPPRGVTAPGGWGCGSWCRPCVGPAPAHGVRVCSPSARGRARYTAMNSGGGHRVGSSAHDVQEEPEAVFFFQLEKKTKLRGNQLIPATWRRF